MLVLLVVYRDKLQRDKHKETAPHRGEYTGSVSSSQLLVSSLIHVFTVRLLCYGFVSIHPSQVEFTNVAERSITHISALTLLVGSFDPQKPSPK